MSMSMRMGMSACNCHSILWLKFAVCHAPNTPPSSLSLLNAAVAVTVTVAAGHNSYLLLVFLVEKIAEKLIRKSSRYMVVTWCVALHLQEVNSRKITYSL